MTTLQIKLAILSMLAEAGEMNLDTARHLYDWVMEGIEVETEEGAEISHLYPIN